MHWQTDPSGTPLPYGSTPTAEPAVTATAMTDHPVPALRAHDPAYPHGDS